MSATLKTLEIDPRAFEALQLYSPLSLAWTSSIRNIPLSRLKRPDDANSVFPKNRFYQYYITVQYNDSARAETYTNVI